MKMMIVYASRIVNTIAIVAAFAVLFALSAPSLAYAVRCDPNPKPEVSASAGMSAAAILAQDSSGIVTRSCKCYDPNIKDASGNLKPFGMTCLITAPFSPTQEAPPQGGTQEQSASAALASRLAENKGTGVTVQCVPDPKIPAGKCNTYTQVGNTVSKKPVELSPSQMESAERGALALQALSATQGNALTGGLLQNAVIQNTSGRPITLDDIMSGQGGIQSVSDTSAPGAGYKEANLGSQREVVGSPSSAPPPVAAPSAHSGGAQSLGPPPASPSGSQSVTNTGGPTFSPSPQLGSSPFNLGPLFGGGGSPSTGSGQAGSGGTIAYVPVNQYPGLTSPNFDTLGVSSNITFPPPQPSPGDVLAYLAQNTKRVKADGFTAEELEDRGVVNTVILQAINNVVTPAGDFIRSLFTAEDVSKSAGEEVSAVAREEKPPLERGRLVLILSADDSLVPGDPTSIANLVEWESQESIPESNRVWVQNAPRAADEIEGIGSAPLSYGWGEPPQIDGRAGGEGASAPQVSDVSYNPFLLPGGLIPEIGEDEGASEPPRSFFSVMGRSFGTITDAIENLFKNIGKALFWWL